MQAAVAAYERAEAALHAASGTADVDAATAAWSAAVLAVADQLPLSAADLRATAGVLAAVRTIEREYPSAEQHALIDAMLDDIRSGRLG